MSHYFEKQKEAAENMAAIIARPMPEDSDLMGVDGEFDPWEVFPCLYGTYSSAFDKCAVEVLCDLRDNEVRRSDLGAQMIREMLCIANLCDYGTSPRVCFPTKEFRELLPVLIEKWRAWALLAWGDGWDQD